MLANGSTAIDGLFGKARGGSGAGLGPITTRKTRTGRVMFFSVCSPMSSKARSSRPAASSLTRAETQIPPGSARPSSRAATLTPSPKMSPSSTTMSPW